MGETDEPSRVPAAPAEGDTAPPRPGGAMGERTLAAAAAGAVSLAVLWALILFAPQVGRGAFDQLNYHLPAILRFAEEFPAMDFSDYLSATTPGYHAVLATVVALTGAEATALRLLSSLPTVALAALLAAWTAGPLGWRLGVVFGLLPLCSSYVLDSGVYLLPDNTGWLLALGVVLLCLRRDARLGTFLAAGSLLACLVAVRQTHLWAAAVMWAAGWWGRAQLVDGSDSLRREFKRVFSAKRARFTGIGVAAACSAPAFAVVGAFAAAWGGLTVPIYQEYMKGPNLATPAFILMQVAILGAPLVGYWGPHLLRHVRRHARVLAAAAGIAALLALVPATDFSVEGGRFGGLWALSRALPAIGGRTSPVLVVLAPAGALMVCGWLAGVSARTRWLLVAVFLGFATAMTASLNAWQRYHEPMLVLIAAVLCASVAWQERDAGVATGRGVRVLRAAGPLAVAALLLAQLALKTRQADTPSLIWYQPDIVERRLDELWPRSWREGGFPQEPTTELGLPWPGPPPPRGD